MRSVVNAHTVKATVIQFHSESGVEGDMETAIEQSVSFYTQQHIELLTDSDVIFMFHYFESSTRYSIVPGYHEGEVDMGGEKSRPNSRYADICVRVILPDLLAPVSLDGFVAYFAEVEISKFHGGEPLYTDAKKFLEDYAMSGGVMHDDGDCCDVAPISAESVECIIRSLGEVADRYASIELWVPEEVYRAYVVSKEAAAKRVAQNARVRLDNLCNAAQARVQCRTDRLCAQYRPDDRLERHAQLPFVQ